MSGETKRTPEEIYDEIAAPYATQVDYSAGNWRELAAEKDEREAELWRELQRAASHETPVWAYVAASIAATAAADRAREMRNRIADLAGREAPREVVEDQADEGALCADDMDLPTERRES